jgi:hypothetical protein
MSQGSTLMPRRSRFGPAPRPGDYFCSDSALYRVERVLGDRVLIEDCRTEALIDISFGELMALRPVRRDGAE